MALFKTEGIDEFVDTVELVKKAYPKEIKRFMQSEGNKLKKQTIEKAKAVIDEHTGNYLKGIKRGKYYKYRENGADSIRVYAGSPARHGHLIEYGHEMVSHNGNRTGKFVRGYHIFKSAADDFEGTYEKDSDKFADKIVEPLNRS